MTQLKRYEYLITIEGKKAYYGSYTIKAHVKPLGFKGEKLVQEFEIPTKQ